MKINYNKVISNAGLVFFTTLAGTTAAGATNPIGAITSAIIMAGIALFAEWNKESTGKTGKIGKTLHHTLIL